MVLCTEIFFEEARLQAESLGMPDLPIVAVPHPLARQHGDVLKTRAQAAWDLVRGGLLETPEGKGAAHENHQVAEVDREIAVEGDLETIQDFMHDRRWTDGLPVVPPTPDRVTRTLKESGLAGDDIVGRFPPKWGVGTVEKVAVNAVMAGCRPQDLPLILAALRAMLKPEFNLLGLQATQNAHTPLTIVNGPIRHQLGLNAGFNVFGQGFRANATIGRAIRLAMVNLGGALPGLMDRSTLGHPGKFTYCIAEHEEANPWEPLHVERGYDREDNAVTVFGGDAPRSISDNSSEGPVGYLGTLAASMADPGILNFYYSGRKLQILVVLNPEVAEMIAARGWSKQDVKLYLFEKARLPLEALVNRGGYRNRHWPAWVDESDRATRVPVVSHPEDIMIVVAGGPSGGSSAWVPSWLSTRSVTSSV